MRAVGDVGTCPAGREDFPAVTRLVLPGLVILPVLPDRPFGPYAVLKPFHIWLMVVLIVGISLAAYLAYELFGGRVRWPAASADRTARAGG